MATKNLIVRIGADLSDLAKATDAARGILRNWSRCGKALLQTSRTA